MSQPGGKVSDVFATPEWAKSVNTQVNARAATQNDLLTADGRCAGPEPIAPAQVTDGVASATPEDGTGRPAEALPALQGGVALQMTECQVVQRLGSPDNFNISADGTVRVTTLTVTRGAWPGLYRFRSGRLVSIERIDVPPPAKPVRAAKSKSPSKSSKAVPLRGAQQ